MQSGSCTNIVQFVSLIEYKSEGVIQYIFLSLLPRYEHHLKVLESTETLLAIIWMEANGSFHSLMLIR
jgi:hypothetical protein